MADPGSLWNCSRAVERAELRCSEMSEAFMAGGVVCSLFVCARQILVCDVEGVVLFLFGRLIADSIEGRANIDLSTY